LEHEALRNIPIILPPLPTQRTIAEFLDRETARIDQLIQKKQRLVELLEEKRLAQTEELLKGDRSTVSRIKFGICKIEQGWSPLCEERAVESDSWGVLKLGAITGRCFDELNHKALPEGVAPRIVYQVKKGDVLIARASGSPALVGRACFVDSISKNLLISDKHYRVRFFNHSFDPRYFVFLLNSRLCREQIETQLSSAEGMARNIGQGVIRNLRTAVPAYTKQKEIANLITEQSRLIANAREKVVASISRLREFRSGLITAAVTGQIDVDEWSRRGGTDAKLDAIAQEMEARA
jgi:type I restriction enzyme S subunit